MSIQDKKKALYIHIQRRYNAMLMGDRPIRPQATFPGEPQPVGRSLPLSSPILFPRDGAAVGRGVVVVGIVGFII